MAEPLVEIRDPGADRYARLRLLDGYSQDRMAAARIMVVGAGALGNEVIKNLALLGAGRVLVVDFDTIEASNLTRSVFFRAEDAGRAKADVIAARAQALNPDVTVVPFTGDVLHDVGLGVYRAVDVVLGCLDNRAARLAVNRACWRAGRPWVDGALNVADGTLRVFVPPEGACYECLMTRRDYELLHVRYACPPTAITEGVQITTPMAASIIAAMQVQEAVRLLHGAPVMGGWGVVYSGETLRSTRLSYPRRADCPAHQRYEPVIALAQGAADLTAGELVARAGERLGERAVLVLPGPVITYLHCPACNTTETVYRPQRDVVPGAVPCPTCGTERVFDVTGAVAGGEATRDLSLARLGIPPYDVVIARGRSGAMVYYDLGGDRRHVLPGW